MKKNDLRRTISYFFYGLWYGSRIVVASSDACAFRRLKMDKWNEIFTDEDIEFFLQKTSGMHDSVLVSAEYTMGCGNTDSGRIVSNQSSAYLLRILFDSDWTERIEMLFTGVRHLNFSGFRDNYLNDIYGCYLGFHTELMGKTRDDRLIVWSDGVFEPIMNGTHIDLKDSDTSFVIAEKMQWRFINEREA